MRGKAAPDGPSFARHPKWDDKEKRKKRVADAPASLCRHFRSAAIRVLGVAQPVGIREANGFGNE